MGWLAPTAVRPGVGMFDVVEQWSHLDEQVTLVTIAGETIETTPWHDFYTDEGWQDAGKLANGDLVLSLDGGYSVVDSVHTLDAVQWMYDLTVEDAHTFAVGTGQWVVHNRDCDYIQVPDGSYWDVRGQQIRDELQLDIRLGPNGEIMTKKNVAFANYDLQGISSNEFGEDIMASGTGEIKAISGNKNLDVWHSLGYLSYPNEYAPFVVPEQRYLDALYKGFDRGTDTEAKILEWFAQRLDDRSSGTIVLYTEKFLCLSCGGDVFNPLNNPIHSQGIIGQFRDEFPNITLVVLYQKP